MYYRQPRYYGEFKCIGPECKANCCYGWHIDWKKDEVEKVKNAPNSSEELRKEIENTFTPQGEDKYIVKFDEKGKCPCVTEEGLCRIQKELGAEYLSHVCTIYPRYNVLYSSEYVTVYRGCNLSCNEIVRFLVNDEKAAELVNVHSSESHAGHSVIFPDTEAELSAHPELEYRRDLLEFFYELIGDKSLNVETSIILGALAAQKLTKLIGDKQYTLIPDALEAFRKQVHNAAALKSINDIKPNYNVKFGVADKLIENALDFRMTDVLKNENGELDIERYFIGEANLNEMMIDKPFWLRNIALNMILELGIPLKLKENTVFENYSYFVAAVSCIKLNAVAAAFAPEKVDIHTQRQTLHFKGLEKIYGLTGIISRRILQNPQAFEDVFRVLDEYGMNSPAYLALLVK